MLTFLSSDWREGFALQRSFADFGIEFEINETRAPRIQTESCKESAAFIAKWGAHELNQPVLKAEKGLFIKALKGLPGIYSELLEEKLGVEGILKLMDGIEKRDAKLSYALAYCEPGKEPIVFESGSTGSITTHKTGNKENTLIDRLYMPEYRFLKKEQTQTLCELAKSEPTLLEHAWGDVEKQFAEWYKAQLQR